jgi:hypothetical protein
MKYGLKILFPDNEYLWITTGYNIFHLEPVLFDSKELALDFVSKTWGSTADNLMFGGKIRVEPYE